MYPHGLDRYKSFSQPPHVLMIPPPPPPSQFFGGQQYTTYGVPAPSPPPPQFSPGCTPQTPASPVGPPSQDVVYIARNPVGRQEPNRERPWSTSIFACLKDLKSCFVTAFCPCVTSGQVAEIVNEGKTSCREGTILFLLFSIFFNCCCYTIYTRNKMRRLYKLKGSTCTDCIAHSCCLPCALCQEYRELYHQGFDPGLGWRENIERQIHSVAVFRVTPPPVEEEMIR